MMLIAFRSRLTAAAGADYTKMSESMDTHARAFPGFVDIKSFTAEDGERLTLVWWADAETLQAWATDAQHMVAKATGRALWYEYYRMEVAEVIRTSSFDRPANT